MSDSRPVLLFDVMSTLVTEPFVEAMPRYFGMSLEDFKAARDPQPWIDFESGRITEAEYAANYWRDGRSLDLDGFKRMLHDAYDLMEGVEPLLEELRAEGYQMFALSNYSQWYEIIEAKTGLSRFLGWDFVSCKMGCRKPDPEAYQIPIRSVGRPANELVFIDDRASNVAAAVEQGMQGILRTPDIDALRRDLRAVGVNVG